MRRHRNTSKPLSHPSRFGRRAGLALSLAVGLTAAMALPALSAVAPSPALQPATRSTGHRYGVVPTRNANSGLSPASGTASTSSGSYLPLQYGGGYNGEGVTTGAPKVYLVFWGSQWGTPSINSQGLTTFSLDADGLAPYLQSFLAGLGTNGETWSGVVTQYCQGVAVGATNCPSSAPHVPAPQGGVLAGVWADTASPTPSQATWSQLAQEATNASVHFGNTTAASNRNAQYFVVSPSGTNPDGFGTSTGGFCAWHDAVTSSAGPIAFINMPYVPDLLQSCGMNAVNAGAAGTLDGVSIVGGHEYSETLTDPYPITGWADSNTEETSDKCGWGGGNVLGNTLADITLATGSFAVQPNWANDANGATGGCELSHPVVTTTNSSSVISVADPGGITTSVGASASLPISATDSAGLALTYDATGLPAGLSLDPSTGIISGTPLAWPTSPSPASWADIVTVQAVDATGANSLTSFVWTIVNATVAIATPPNQTSTSGTGASLQLAATDSAGGALTYSAGGLPPGLSIGTSTGSISGVPVTAGSYWVDVAATDPWGATASTSFWWTVSAPVSVPPPAPTPSSGYWMLGAGGTVYPFSAPALGQPASNGGRSAVAMVSTPTGQGYWVAFNNGDVASFGDAGFYGSDPALQSGEAITSISAMPNGTGYWLFSNLGRVFPYGSAPNYGDMSGHALNGPVLGSVATPSGKGYYMVASDGGVFAFGDAQFTGSMGGHHLNAAVVGLAPSPTGYGYWLVASDGGIFAFGGTPFLGSMGGHALNKPVIGAVAYGNGYLMVASDGGIFDFSNMPFAGSLGTSVLPSPIVAVAPVA